MSNLKFYREKSRLTQEELCLRLKIKQTTYSNYELGKTEAPYNVLKELSKIYNITIDQLLDNETEGKAVYSPEQLETIKNLCLLNDDYFDLASKYIKNLLADQVELENKRNLLKNSI